MAPGPRTGRAEERSGEAERENREVPWLAVSHPPNQQRAERRGLCRIGPSHTTCAKFLQVPGDVSPPARSTGRLSRQGRFRKRLRQQTAPPWRPRTELRCPVISKPGPSSAAAPAPRRRLPRCRVSVHARLTGRRPAVAFVHTHGDSPRMCDLPAAGSDSAPMALLLALPVGRTCAGPLCPLAPVPPTPLTLYGADTAIGGLVIQLHTTSTNDSRLEKTTAWTSDHAWLGAGPR
jgi:hypothetical protein